MRYIPDFPAMFFDHEESYRKSSKFSGDVSDQEETCNRRAPDFPAIFPENHQKIYPRFPDQNLEP